MTTIGNVLIYSARSPENNPNININQNCAKNKEKNKFYDFLKTDKIKFYFF